jgi:hypothetical protein
MKFLEENLEKTLQDIATGNDCLDITLRAKIAK